MIIIRRLYSRSSFASKHLKPSKKDPGVKRQKTIFKESPSDLEYTDFEELESDFMNVQQSHKEHLREMEARHEKRKYLIVKQKYFKEKLPNFLTWHDKEQIRYLFNTYPEEWTVDRLSEGFPALPEVIEQIIKNRWNKKNLSKISNHDKGVLKNWEDFKQGQLNNLPPELKEHLQKFTNRVLNFEPFQKTDGKEIIIDGTHKNRPPSGEFSEIIDSYQRLKEKNLEKKELNIDTVDMSSIETKASKSKRKNQPLVTLKQLHDQVVQKELLGIEVSMEDKLLREGSGPKLSKKEVKLDTENIFSIIETRHNTNEDKVGFVRKTTRDMSHLIYPEKIVIPDKIYKKGYTYKLNDCYYDSDGEFLYRVPGMD